MIATNKAKNKWIYVSGEKADTYFKCGGCGTNFNIQRNSDGRICGAGKHRYCSACGDFNLFDTEYAEEITPKSYKISFVLDGYRFKDVVSAENEDVAIKYFAWVYGDALSCTGYKVEEETDEVATYYCPIGWRYSESRELARQKSYNMWRNNYLKDFMKGEHIEDTPELQAFLAAEGWKRSEQPFIDCFEELDLTVTIYTRGSTTITL